VNERGALVMNWIERWRAIAARISGLMEATKFQLQAYQVQNHNTGMLRALIHDLRQIHEELKILHEDCHSQMPPLAATALQEFCNKPIPDPTPTGEAVDFQLLIPTAIFLSRFNYLIQDMEIEGRTATELAFEHLRRLIAIDKDVRAKWSDAFQQGETACEKMGAVHLLAHGIWAFKVRNGRAETDLVYGETEGSPNSVIRRTARALVLTEWKLVRDPRGADSKGAEARRQASEYSGGVLGDLELKRTRFIVLVGQHEQTPPDDREEGGVNYRHIWLSVDPKTPSVSARRRALRE